MNGELIDSIPWWWALPACLILSLVFILDVRAERARARRARLKVAALDAESDALERATERLRAGMRPDPRDLAFLDSLRNARRSPEVAS